MNFAAAQRKQRSEGAPSTSLPPLLRRTSLEECRNKSVGEVMHTVLHGDIPLDYGPWLHMSPEGLDLMCRLTHR